MSFVKAAISIDDNDISAPRDIRFKDAARPQPEFPRTAGVVLEPPSNALGRRGRVQPLAVGEVVVG